MDNLSERIGALLSDPNSMEQLKSMAGALGLDTNGLNLGSQAPAPPLAAAPMSSGAFNGAGLSSLLSGLLGGSGNAAGNAGHNSSENTSHAGSNNTNTGGLGDLGGADIMQTILKVAPLLSSLRQEDDSTRLLHALRPLLGEARRSKLDNAVRLLQLMKALPLLKSTGILQGIL